MPSPSRGLRIERHGAYQSQDLLGNWGSGEPRSMLIAIRALGTGTRGRRQARHRPLHIEFLKKNQKCRKEGNVPNISKKLQNYFLNIVFFYRECIYFLSSLIILLKYKFASKFPASPPRGMNLRRPSSAESCSKHRRHIWNHGTIKHTRTVIPKLRTWFRMPLQSCPRQMRCCGSRQLCPSMKNLSDRLT